MVLRTIAILRLNKFLWEKEIRNHEKAKLLKAPMVIGACAKAIRLAPKKRKKLNSISF